MTRYEKIKTIYFVKNKRKIRSEEPSSLRKYSKVKSLFSDLLNSI